MALYRYTALDEQGARQQGVEPSDDATALRRALRARGLTPVDIRDATALGRFWLVGAAGARRLVPARRMQQLLKQLALLLDGGLALEKALDLLLGQAATSGEKQCLTALRNQLREGVALSDAMATLPADFPPMQCATVAAGERSAKLNVVLHHIAEHMERRLELRQKMLLALFYPALLTVFALAVAAGLLVFVVPDLAKTFRASGQALPWLTQAVLALSAGLRVAAPWLFFALLLAVPLVLRAWHSPPARLRFDRWLLRLPVLGPLAVQADLSAYSATLAILLTSGVTLPDAMATSARVVRNRELALSLQAARTQVCEGGSLHRALARVPAMPATLVGLVQGGEASGELARAMALAAAQQDKALEVRARWLVGIVEPCIILLTGLLVLVIVLAMMMPILSLNQLVR
jgi:general secretion pathway protein F